MAGKTIGGISGVLGELISPAPPPTESSQSSQLPIAERETNSAKDAQPVPLRSCRARLGRPPGNITRHRVSKEKVTLRIPSDLIAEYRDRSWEARCQLSELVIGRSPFTENRALGHNLELAPNNVKIAVCAEIWALNTLTMQFLEW